MKEIIAAVVTVMFLMQIVLSEAAYVQSSRPQLVETFLNQDPDPAQPGKYVELRWKVEKTGIDEISGIEYFLEAEYPFFFDPSDEPARNLENWKGYSLDNEFHTLHYKVRVDEDAVEDTYTLRLKRKTAETDVTVIQKYDIRVGEKNRPEFTLGQLSTSPMKLASDTDEAKISVEIANIGDGSAENVVVEVAFPEGFDPSHSYSYREALGTFGPGMGKTATFYVDIDKDVTGGEHIAKLSINYKESDDKDNEMKNKVIDLLLPLKDKPQFEIESVLTDPEIVMPGDTVELRINLLNAGGTEAESVSVRAFKDSSQPFDLFEKSDFVGKVKPGETGEAILKLNVDNNANPKRYTLDLEIRAIDGEEVIIQEKTMTILVDGNVTSGNDLTGAIIEELSPALLGVFVFVLLVVGSLAYLTGKRRRPKKK